MLRVGLTGGIGAGKSTAARLLAECGAAVIDADQVAREIVAPGTLGLAALVAAFGSDILLDDGQLNRPALAAKAFQDDGARAKLNAITHPRVAARTAELLSAVSADAIVVQDIPLLVENGLGPLFNLVVVVDVSAAERVRRLAEHRGVAVADARARTAAQASDEQRHAAADVLLDNSGAADALTGQVRALWDGRLVPFAANISTRTAVGYRPVLVPADPAWPGQARRLIARLQLVCGAAARRIDHVGSTSVAGLDAKDVIDIQVTVPDTGVAESLVRPLAEAGFPRRSTAGAQRSGSTIDPAFVATHVHSGADPGRPVNIHLRTEGSPAQRFALLFRDWLAASPAVRAEYLTVKRRAESAAGLRTGDELAARHAYNLVKEPWFATAVERAAEWARETGWTP